MAAREIKYVLITPARNEDRFIEKTITSVISQTILPDKWIIISDGSTDRTDVIVRKYAAQHSFIKLLRREPDGERNFGSKVYAIQEGIKLLTNTNYDYIGNLDADVSFGADYYKNVLNHMYNNPKLGIAGGILLDKHDDGFKKQFSSENSVSGPIQLFRRKCYEEIGGYTPSRHGHVDAIAEITARMYGWTTQSFPKLHVYHYRRTGSEGRSIWSGRFREGKLEYLIGYHPLFHFARAFQRLVERPYLIGSCIRTCGYLLAYLNKPEGRVSRAFIDYVRKEEFQKLKSLFFYSKKM